MALAASSALPPPKPMTSSQFSFFATATPRSTAEISGSPETEKVAALTRFYKRRGIRVGVLCTDETAQYYDADIVKSLGSRSDMADVARNLFKLLREFDLENVDMIVAEGFPAQGLGLAVMNRLRKAAGYNIVKA